MKCVSWRSVTTWTTGESTKSTWSLAVKTNSTPGIYDIETKISDININLIFSHRKEHIEDEMKKEANNVKKEVEEDFGNGKFAKYQRILWDLIEKPHTSTPAKV